MQSILLPTEVDEILRYKPGQSQRLARRNRMPHLILPDGSIRFLQSEVEKLIGMPLSELEAKTPHEVN